MPEGRGAQQPSGKGGKQDSKPSAKPRQKQALLATAVPNSSSSDDDIDCVYIDSGPLMLVPKHSWHIAEKVPGSQERPGTRLGILYLPGGDRTFRVGQHEGLSYRFPGYVVWGGSLKAVGSWDLADFLDWVQNYYIIHEQIHEQSMEVERREVPLSEISGASGSDGPPIAIPASSAHKTVKGKPPNPPLPVSCAVCTNFSHLGTNAYVTVKTCKVCGKVNKEKKVFEKKGPTRCPHVNTSQLGSNKATAKTFCKDCGHIEDEMPQEEAQRRRKAAQEIETATSASFDLISSIAQNVTDDVKLDAMQTMTLVEEFKLKVEDYIVSQNVEGNSEPTVTPKELHEILNDLLEDVMVQQEDAPSVRSTPGELSIAAPSRAAESGSRDRRPKTGRDRAAFMAVKPEPLPSTVPLVLEKVVIFQREDVFGVLDDGANSSVCGRKWCDNPETKLQKLGFEFPWLSKDGVSFKGLGGSTKTLGDKRMVFCVGCGNKDANSENQDPPLPGILDCHVT